MARGAVVPIREIAWNPDITPGETFRAHTALVIPHAGDFWGEPKHVSERASADGVNWFGTHALTPWNDHFEKHWVYSAAVGDVHTWYDDDYSETIAWRYLGVYRVWGLTPNDWRTGIATFSPVQVTS